MLWQVFKISKYTSPIKLTYATIVQKSRYRQLIQTRAEKEHSISNFSLFFSCSAVYGSQYQNILAPSSLLMPLLYKKVDTDNLFKHERKKNTQSQISACFFRVPQSTVVYGSLRTGTVCARFVCIPLSHKSSIWSIRLPFADSFNHL